MHSRAWASLIASLIAVSMPAFGESAPRTVFTPADFEDFSPRTALDMVREVPGFSIERSDNDSRGLGQASGNVLIDGERLTGKSTSAVDVLSRLPARKVVRIELSDASALAIPGLSGQVVNIVTEGDGVSGVWEWKPRFRRRLEPRYNRGNAAVNGSFGDISWTLGLQSEANRFGNKGPEFLIDPGGALIERRDEDFEAQREYLEGSLALNWKPDGTREANLNASYVDFNNVRRLRGVRQPAGNDPFSRVFTGGEDEWNSEIGADYAFDWLGGRLKLIGLHRHEDSRQRDTVEARSLIDGDITESDRVDQDFVENEAVLRTEFGWVPGQGRDWQLAGEQAYNRLDAGALTFDPDGEGGFGPGTPDTPTRVEETRGEVSLTHGRQLAPRWRLQVSIAADYSEISSRRGDTALSRNFLRPKGYVQTSWEPGDASRLSLRLEREVGQLNFFDFVGSQDINRGNDNAGNRELVPDQTWRLEAELDRRFGEAGALTLVVFHEEIEDIIDRIPLGDGEDGPGNIDAARRTGFELDTELRLDAIGLAGVQWRFDYDWQHSRLDDPLTGESRVIGRDDISRFFAELRWDVPGTPYAFLVASERELDAKRFRLDEIRSDSISEPFLWVEARHKDLFGIDAYVRLGNLLDARDSETRVIFTPDRTGQVIRRQASDRDFGPILSFGFSGSF